ncbi:hypothetical protein [Nocardia jiangsuensis]|uniref:Uncharacterized protein n=1 Tax=Nocardia jiangsuensis TaxID=1691563 RepID=A0ABV8DKE4_9NOCA
MNVAGKRSLADIAEISGFTATDLAFLAKVQESTVCRLWDDPSWLNRVRGTTLQSLITVLPGVAEYVSDYTLGTRRLGLFDNLSREGLAVRLDRYRQLVSNGIPEQYLANALDAALRIVKGDERQSAAHLARFWGREQDAALGHMFLVRDGLFEDGQLLLETSVEMAELLGSRASSFHAILAHCTLVHHVAKATGATLLDSEGTNFNKKSALSYRSGVMGLIIQTNDREVAEQYAARIESNSLLATVESWALPTYSSDSRTTPDFSLPRSILLKRTAIEIIRELEEYNDAYLSYLSAVAIPSALSRDNTFGLKRDELAAALAARIERCEDGRTRAAAAKLLKDLY